MSVVPMYRGVLHIHSTLSDGALSPKAIRERARSEGLDFVVLCEHAKYLVPRLFNEAVGECIRLSSETFLMMLGLEFEYRGRHILALGPPEVIGELDAETVGGTPCEVRKRGGLTIWAHPACTYDWSLREGMRADYDGWEVWNRAFDGPVPSIPIAAALRKQRQRARPLLAFGGADFHQAAQELAPLVAISVPWLTARALTAALKEGGYRILGRGCSDKPVVSADSFSVGLSMVGYSYAAARYAANRGRSAGADVVARLAPSGWVPRLLRSAWRLRR